MTDKLVSIIGTTLILVTAAGPAMAGIPAPVPEPATMTLFGLGAAGAFVARKLVKRK